MAGPQVPKVHDIQKLYEKTGIKDHFIRNRYKIFKSETDPGVEGGETFFKEPFKELSIQFLEHVRLAVNQEIEHKSKLEDKVVKITDQPFKSVNELYNFILLSSSFDLSEELDPTLLAMRFVKPLYDCLLYTSDDAAD